MGMSFFFQYAASMYFGDGEDEDSSAAKTTAGGHAKYDYGDMVREEQEAGGPRRYYDAGEGLDTDVARVDEPPTDAALNEGEREAYTHVNVRYCIS